MRRISTFHLILLATIATFILIFPKGGIKISEVPITWGYLLLGIYGVCRLMFAFSIYKQHIIASALVLTFLFWCAISMLFYNNTTSLFALQTFVTFGVTPLLSLTTVGPDFSQIPEKNKMQFMKVTLWVCSVFGIISFLAFLLYQSDLQIPYLTANGMEQHLSPLDKHNDRGGIAKLASTYGNGNLYGIGMLMLYPLIFSFKKQRLIRSLTRISLFLTLSRTVWLIGYISDVLAIFLFASKRNQERWKTFRSIIVVTVLYALITNTISNLLLSYDQFMSDTSLGDRAVQFDTLKHISFFGYEMINDIPEIVYLAVANHYGLLGLSLFLMSFIAPLTLVIAYHGSIAKSITNLSHWQIGLALGQINYLLCCLGDGGILMIPIMAIYWIEAGELLVAAPISYSNSLKRLSNL